jgi:hypothetical protein
MSGPFVRERVAHIRLQQLADPVAAMHVGIAAEKVGDFTAGTRFLTRAVEGLREQVRLGPLTQALIHLAWAEMHTGDWVVAAAASAEGARMARDTRQPQYGLTGELANWSARLLLRCAERSQTSRRSLRSRSGYSSR